MLQDMWASVESDFHFGNPGSSCDAIVSIWRSLVSKNASTVYPKKCFQGYFEPAFDTPKAKTLMNNNKLVSLSCALE